MPSLPYRAPRLDFSFAVELHTRCEVLNGHSLNISASGMLASFNPPPELWTAGRLWLHYGEGDLQLPVRVARTEGSEAGLAFVFTSGEERRALDAVLAIASARTQLTGRPPF